MARQQDKEPITADQVRTNPLDFDPRKGVDKNYTRDYAPAVGMSHTRDGGETLITGVSRTQAAMCWSISRAHRRSRSPIRRAMCRITRPCGAAKRGEAIPQA